MVARDLLIPHLGGGDLEERGVVHPVRHHWAFHGRDAPLVIFPMARAALVPLLRNIHTPHYGAPITGLHLIYGENALLCGRGRWCGLGLCGGTG